MNDSSIQSEGESARDALVIAERGASLVATLARLDRLSRRIETIIQNNAGTALPIGCAIIICPKQLQAA